MITDEMRSGLWPLLAGVKRPGRYIGGEWGAYTRWNNPDESRRPVRFCLAFPDVYEVGMSYLGYQILYSMIKTLDCADVERVYCPWPDMEDAMRSAGVSLRSLESGRSLREFDAIGVTLQYELCSTNILTILDLGGVPILSSERLDDDPLIIGGGGGALAPAPLEIFFDAFCLGDGEAIIPEMISLMGELKGRPRSERLDAMSRIEGVYVPGETKRRATRRIVENLDDSFIHRTMIVPNGKIIHDRMAVQVFKGCTRGCRFCQAGMTDRPVRERSAGSVAGQIDDLRRYTGWDEIGLLSLATCDWSGLGELLSSISPMLEEHSVKLGLPSLRMDSFSVELASSLEGMRHGGITFAPEAGSDRLRTVINKGVSDGDIDSALDAAFKYGWDRVKLYFMMGLPTETEADLDGIIDIANRAVHFARIHKKKGDVSVSLAGFVPKAHTPFQWEPQASRDALRERGRYVKGKIRSKKISLSYHEPNQTLLEGIYARGDRSLGFATLEAWRRGARFDGWTECFDMGIWESVCRDLCVDMERAVGARALDEPLPWDMIDIGVTKDFLISERARAFDLEMTPDCRDGCCNACGWQNKFTGCGAVSMERPVR
ncbi:MAG: B12-binding domain-containing radical SAM protein [Synergistaceae bacterium]|jgi:radical SAM superfamily enzyme YgiQ (UPF0313 family)|nr:B12-binding domain-containing radical SAM protein [Synergistaceae bacterium]